MGNLRKLHGSPVDDSVRDRFRPSPGRRRTSVLRRFPGSIKKAVNAAASDLKISPPADTSWDRTRRASFPGVPFDARFGFENGWGGRIRTSECRNQNPVSCHLTTPQQAPDAPITRRRSIANLYTRSLSQLPDTPDFYVYGYVPIVFCIQLRTRSSAVAMRHRRRFSRLFQARRASAAFSKRPNTVGPLPLISAPRAPCFISAVLAS